MQDRPDKATLLRGVAQFLQREVQPQVGDKALAFRVLIAAHLCAVAAAEGELEQAEDDAQAERLRALLPELAPSGEERGAAARRAVILTGNRELCRLLRAGLLDEGRLVAVRAHIVATLREKLRVVSPRFDTAAAIE